MSLDPDKVLLEERKIKALERIADNLESLTLWFEDIDAEDWGDRLAWYLSLWKDKYIGETDEEAGNSGPLSK